MRFVRCLKGWSFNSVAFSEIIQKLEVCHVWKTPPKTLWKIKGVSYDRTMASKSISSLIQTFPQKVSDYSKTVASRVSIFANRIKESKSTHHVIKLQFEAFFQRHGRILIGLGTLILGYGIWSLTSMLSSHLTSTIGSSIHNNSLAIAVFLMGSLFVYSRKRFSVDPDAVYRLALLKMNTHPGILEVMGAPLAGSTTKSIVFSGGGLKLTGWMPHYHSRRLKMVFPVYGTHREGVVFLAAKKRKGKYLLKVLGVDVRMPDDQEQRIYLEGDSVAYSRGDVLLALREPLDKAILSEELEVQEDEKEDREDEKREREEQERQEREKLEKEPKGLDEGGGMYLYEKLYWQARILGTRIMNWRQKQRMA